MLSKPSLSVLPIEEELQSELNINVKKVKSTQTTLTISLFFWLIIYSLVVYFGEMSLELAWVIGFPLFVIVGAVFAVLVQLYQINLSNSTINEYFYKHLLFRLEEINKGIENKGINKS